MTANPSSPRTDDDRWQAVLAGDAAADGAFVYAVRSTGVYCRPSCRSRKPRRRNVTFFTVPEAAHAAGYRPCKRCRPDAVTAPDPTVETVRRLCRTIADWPEGLPTLADLAEEAGLSPHHLQRLFKRVAGVSPRQYAEALRLDRFKAEVRGGAAVSDALYGAGFGASSRLYEAAGRTLGMTPATYARGGRGAVIGYRIVDAPLGRLLAAATGRGLCAVFLGDDDAALVAALRAEYPVAEIAPDDRRLEAWTAAIVGLLDGRQPHVDLPTDVRATAFQGLVWRRLQTIPRGETRSYGEIAADIGRPGAARAVGRACAGNPLALVVPCHRAVGADGDLTGYRWGRERKAALLQREAKAE